MKAYYIFQQADEETISNILDWMRNQERAIYRAAVRELGALAIVMAALLAGTTRWYPVTGSNRGQTD